jgi:hypothetical protein
VALRPLGLSEALRKGFGLAFGAPGVVGLALFAQVGSDLLSLGVLASVGAVALAALGRAMGSEPLGLLLDPHGLGQSFLAELTSGAKLPPLAGAILVATLISLALRLLWVSAGARSFGERLRGRPGLSAVPAAASRLHRAAAVGALFVPIYLAMILILVTALGASTLSWVHAVTIRSGGLAGAFSVALAASLGLFLSFAFDTLLRLALIRAVCADVGPVEALVGAGRVVATRVPALLGLMVLFGVLAIVTGAIGGSGAAFVVGKGPAAMALLLSVRTLTGLVGSLLSAFLSTAELGAYCALDSQERGVLPAPPIAEPILETTIAERTLP